MEQSHIMNCFSSFSFKQFVLIAGFFVGLCAPLIAQQTIDPLPPALERLMPPATPYKLDAGTSQVLLLNRDGTASTTVRVTLTATDSNHDHVPQLSWSVSRAPERGEVKFGSPMAAETTVMFRKPGAYFLRVDASEGKWRDWESVVVQVVSAGETGFAMRERISALPEPGVHPRIFFSPEDIPSMRQRFKNSVSGREMAKKLELNSIFLRKGIAGYDPKSPIATMIDGKPTVVNPAYFCRAFDTYHQLIAGDTHALGEKVRDMDYGGIVNLGKQMACEAFWCLIQDDKKGAEDVAKAITTWSKIVAPTIEPQDDWQWNGSTFGLVHYGTQKMGRIFEKVGRENVGLCYDFIYNYMTPEQRDTVRGMISKATSGKIGSGMDQPHYARVGNWLTYHTSALLLEALAIEGEPGSDPATYRKAAETFADFYEYSVLEDGESFESLGKGGAWPYVVPAMARRGDWVAAHPHLRDYYRRYLLNCFQPYRYHYIALSTLGDAELSGGMKVDACVAKQCYPDDPAVDLVYRNLMGENYGGEFSPDTLLPLSLWSTDYKIPAGKAWDWDKNQPLTYIGRDQGLVVTRSDWSDNALYLYFDCGSNIRDMGHYDPARNVFILSALGRNWIGDTGKEELAEAHSVVLIDGKGGSKCPGRLVNVSDRPEATALCGNAKFAYDWQWDRSTHTHGEVEPITVNQIRFEPLPERWMETPLTYLYSFFAPFRLVRSPYNPVQCAYRSALLRRGAHPYALVADSIQKDGESHRYEFLLRIAPDLENQVQIKGNDLILSDPKTDRRMLVRFVTPGKIEVTQHQVLLRKDTKLSRPVISVAVDSIRPDYRVLFYPYREGEPLPTTTWTQAAGELQLRAGTQTDTLRLETSPKGEPEIRLLPGSQRVVVTKP